MNICGVLIHAHPAKLSQVIAELATLHGVDVHGQSEGGRIATTIEDTPVSQAFDTLANIHRLDGIVAASLVFHHFEPATSAGPATSKEGCLP